VCFGLVAFVSDTWTRKNRFLVCFGLLVFVSDICMRKNHFLVCFWMLLFVSDVSLCALGCWFSSMLHVSLVEKGDLTSAYEDG